MTCKFNVPGKKRKELALTIATWLGCEVSYKGAPTFAYEVDYFTINKDGTLSFDDRADSEVNSTGILLSNLTALFLCC